MKYLYDPPGLVKYIYSQLQWNTINNKVLLTFDDGPIPETTPIILNYLDKHKIKAVFFCVGDNIIKNPGLFSEIVKENHLPGNHTFHHKKLTKLKTDAARNEISSVNKVLSDQFKYSVEYFRPPYGKFNFKMTKILKEEKLKPVMWSLLTGDYKNELNLVKFVVDKYLKQDSIVVLHDSLRSKDIILQALDYILDKAVKMNFEIGEPSGCLK